MRKVAFLLFTTTVAVVLFSASAWAAAVPSNMDLMREIRELRQIVEQQNSRIIELESRMEVHKDTIREHGEMMKEKGIAVPRKIMDAVLEGLDIGATGTFVGQGARNVNNAGVGEDSIFDGSFTIELEVAKEFDDWGMAYILMEAGQGDTIQNELMVFSNVNYDADDTLGLISVNEVWYEHYLFDDQIVLTGGKIDTTNYLDVNEYAHDENRQFLAWMFRQATTVEFPNATGPGARIALAPDAIDCIELEGIWAEADADWDRLFDHPFISTQLNFMPAKAFGYDEEMWAGNYRVYFWYNGNDHVKLKDEEKTKKRNFGMGLSWDQMLTDTYGVFGRFGWQDPSVSAVEYHWSLGGQMTGKYWNREEDVLAIAVGQDMPGLPYGRAGNPHNNETHLETYYSFKVNDHLTISPDMQLIWRPNGVGNKDQGDRATIFVYGARGFVEF